MSRIPRLLVLGSFNADHSFDYRPPPPPGGTQTITEYEESVGGKALNVAVVAARYGLFTAACGRVGNDRRGERVITALRENRVETRYLQVTEEPTGVALTAREADGANRYWVFDGANQGYDPGVIRSAIDNYAPHAFYTTFEPESKVLNDILPYCKTKGIFTVADASPDATALSDLSAINLITINATEAEQRTGVPVQTKASAVDAADKLLQDGAAAVLITAGATFVHYRSQKGTALTIPVPSTKAVDKAGAGDSLRGVFLARYLLGLPLEKALKEAVNILPFVVETKGTYPSLPNPRKQ